MNAYPCVCDGILVVGVCRADEVIVGHEGFGGELLENGGALIAEQLGLYAGFGRRLLDLQAVLISAGAHESVLALEQPPSLENIGEHQRVEVTDVWRYCTYQRCSLERCIMGTSPRVNTPALT